MASTADITAGVIDYHTFRQAYATATTDEQRAILTWHVYRLFEAFHAARTQQIAASQANQAPSPPGSNMILVSDYIKQLTNQANNEAAIIGAQKSYSIASKSRARSAKIAHQQRKKDLENEIQTHESAIDTIKTQLTMMQSEHKAENTLFDNLDAIDMQLEDERRLPATAITARLERDTKRAANETLVATMNAEISALNAKISLAQQTFEAHLRTTTLTAVRASLRELKTLKAARGKVPKGAHKPSFWNAIRRALTKKSPGAEDMSVYEKYKRELEGPVLADKDVCGVSCGVPIAREAVEEWPEVGEESEGMFFLCGWQS